MPIPSTGAEEKKIDDKRDEEKHNSPKTEQLSDCDKSVIPNEESTEEQPKEDNEEIKQDEERVQEKNIDDKRDEEANKPKTEESSECDEVIISEIVNNLLEKATEDSGAAP